MKKFVLFVVGYCIASFFYQTACHKEQNPLLGAWQPASPVIPSKGYWFYEDGTVCRYVKRTEPVDSSDCQYKYTYQNDTLRIDGPNGQDSYRLEFISPDFIRVFTPASGQLINVFFLEREK